jgi:hypothetical protein
MLRYLRNRARLRSVMSASGGKADIPFDRCNVCFWPKADLT